MTDEDPVPLKADVEATPELVRALHALGRRDPDVARLARVAEKLGAALADMPPPGSSNGFRKLVGTKTLITAIVVGIATLSWFGYHLAGRRVPAPETARPPSATESSSAAQPANPRAEVPSNRDGRDHFANTLPPTAAGPTDAPQARVAPSRRSLRRAVAPQPAVAPPVQSPQPTVSSPAASAATAAVAASAPSAPVASNPVAKAPSDQNEREHAHAPSAPQRSELELLFDARKAMPAQPAAALRLLDEHATRFPSGLLGPEREVLTIEALRKLGRTAEATKRLRQFESRYPKSIHLRRLQGDAGSR